jgi:hypothetical protein
MLLVVAAEIIEHVQSVSKPVDADLSENDFAGLSQRQPQRVQRLRRRFCSSQ